MKKYLAMLLAVLLLASLSSAAFAESTTVEIDTVELSIDDWNYEGGVTTTISNVGIKIWLPEYLVDGEQELTEEEESRGFLLKMEDVEGGPLAFAVAGLGADIESLEEYAAYLLTNDGYTSVKMADINDIPALVYYMPSLDTEAVAFHLNNNDILELYFTPAADEACSDLIRAMISSIQVAED